MEVVLQVCVAFCPSPLSPLAAPLVPVLVERVRAPVLHLDAALAAVRHGRGVEVALVAEKVAAEMADPVWFCAADLG